MRRSNASSRAASIKAARIRRDMQLGPQRRAQQDLAGLARRAREPGTEVGAALHWPTLVFAGGFIAYGGGLSAQDNPFTTAEPEFREHWINGFAGTRPRGSASAAPPTRAFTTFADRSQPKED